MADKAPTDDFTQWRMLAAVFLIGVALMRPECNVINGVVAAVGGLIFPSKAVFSGPKQ